MNFISDLNHTYLLNQEGKMIAELQYEVSEINEMTITHTVVDKEMQGKGIAGKLVEAGVNYLKSNGYTVKATCSYAKKWLETNEIK